MIYDCSAFVHHASTVSTERIHQTVVDMASVYAASAPLEHHLDVGAGSGRLIELFRLKFGTESFACDYTDQLMKLPGQKVDIVNLNNEKLPYKDASFDIITATEVVEHLENHHNFAWKEKHVIDGVEREVIVHRKGATPAGAGVLGIIPGSMATPGLVVSGKGNAESLNSASHGAGRAMSRKAANEKFNWKEVSRFLRGRGATLISADLDEVPMAYKNIREVMAAQNDLVTALGQFDPKLVKMAPSGERPED